jgi:hypothetical protein
MLWNYLRIHARARILVILTCKLCNVILCHIIFVHWKIILKIQGNHLIPCHISPLKIIKKIRKIYYNSLRDILYIKVGDLAQPWQRPHQLLIFDRLIFQKDNFLLLDSGRIGLPPLLPPHDIKENCKKQLACHRRVTNSGITQSVKFPCCSSAVFRCSIKCMRQTYL